MKFTGRLWTMRNILVMSVNWLGDVVFSTPVYRALKRKYPDARIVALGVPRVKDVLLMCPDIDEVIVYDEQRSVRGSIRMIVTAAGLRSRRFDAVLLLRKSFSRTMMAWLAGIPGRAGFADDRWSALLTHRADARGCDDLHRSDVYLRVAEAMDITVRDRSCRLSVSRDDCEKIATRLRAAGLSGDERIVVLNTGGNWALKQWPPERFAELAARLTRELGFKVVLPGSAADVERVRAIARSSGVDPLVLAGETTLPEMAALFKRAHAVVSADSGPLHMAHAIGANVVAIFGPTREEITGPRGQGRSRVLSADVGCNHTPCYYLECPDNRCMKAVTVDDVLSTFKVLKS